MKERGRARILDRLPPKEARIVSRAVQRYEREEGAWR